MKTGVWKSAAHTVLLTTSAMTHAQTLDNFRRRLYSQARAGAKTCLAVCLNKFTHLNKCISISYFLGPVAKSFVVLRAQTLY